MKSEPQIMADVRLVLGGDPLGVWWRNNIGMAPNGRGGFIRYGVGGPGGADLIGMYRGRFVAVETKTAIGRLSIEQKRYRDLVIAKGGIYAVVRSIEDARVLLVSLQNA